jgi:tripartite ATP-independent transporter DctP family solute receptor
MKKIMFLTLISVCFFCVQVSYAEVTIKLAHVLDPRHPCHTALLGFKDDLENRTNGEIKVQIFHSSQLGNDRQLVEGLKMGTVHMAVNNTANYSRFIPEFGLFDLPFVFENPEHAQRFYETETAQSFFEMAEDIGIKPLAWWSWGFRHFYNSKKLIKNISDMKGMKIRIMESPVYADTFRALGADPTPMAYSEVYTALQQKTVDGAENALIAYYAMRHSEVAPYLSLSYYVHLQGIFGASKIWFDQLEKKHQQIIEEAAKTCARYYNQIFHASEEQVLATLKGEGVEIVTMSQEGFEDAIGPVKKKYAKKIEGGEEALSIIEGLKK